MVDLGVALAWVAISCVSLKWLSVFAQRPEGDAREPEILFRDGDLLPEELYPLEFTPVAVGSPN